MYNRYPLPAIENAATFYQCLPEQKKEAKSSERRPNYDQNDVAIYQPHHPSEEKEKTL